MRSSIAAKIGIPLVLLACGGAASFVAFWGFLSHTGSYDSFGNGVPQILIGIQDVRLMADLAVQGDSGSREALRRQAASFNELLSVLQKGGTWAGVVREAPPADAAEALTGVRRLWKDAERALRILADSPPGAPRSEREQLHIEAAKLLNALSAEAAGVLEGCARARRTHQREFLGVLAGIAVLDLLLFASGLWLARRHVVRPVRMIEQAARRLQGGDFSARVPVVTHDELATLAAAFNDMSAEISRLLATVDTERRAAVASRERLTELISDLDAIVWEGDGHGWLTFVSEGAQPILGYPASTWLADPEFWVSHIHPDDRQRVLDESRGGVAEPGHHHIEYRMLAADGRIVWLHGKVRVSQPDASGIPIRGLMVDITDRKRAEEALAQSEATSRALLNAIPDMIFRVTVEGRVVDLRGGSAALRFAPPEGLLGHSVEQVLPPSAAARLLECVRAAIKTGRIEIFHYERPGEAPLDLEIRVVGLGRDEALAIVRDVTEQRQGERAVRRAEQELRLVMSSLTDAVWSADSAGGRIRMRYCSPVLERITGRLPEWCFEREWADAIHPEDRARAIDEFAKIIEGAAGGEIEYRIVRADGSVRWLRDSINLNRLDGGRLRLYGVLSDITAHKLKDESLRKVNDTLRAVIEASPLAIYAVDYEGRLQSWNRAAEAMFGWMAQDVLGGAIPSVPDDEIVPFSSVLERVRRGERLSGCEVRGRRKDGTAVDISLWTADLRDAAGAIRGFIIVCADVTQRKTLEEQLRQAQKMEAVGRLAGGVAHDFNNLLTVITCYAQLAHDETALAPDARENIDEVLKAAGRASTLTNQLLAFSRRQIARMRIVDLNEIVSNMDRMLRRIIGEHIQLAAELDPDLATIRADPAQLEQVILNLVVNARDAMPEGGRITIRTANSGGAVCLWVLDTGCGMDAATQKQVFEPFFTTKALGEGTGLGLSMVYGIVKQTGGEISVSSAPGQGATFTVVFPAAAAEAVAPEPQPAAPARSGGTGTILLVEDDDAVRTLAGIILRGCGYNVLEAGTPSAALSICNEPANRIDLLLTDIIMPEMNGRELATRLAPSRPEMKILFMSGYAEDPALRSVLGASGAAFLQKPFTPSALTDRVRQALG